MKIYPSSSLKKKLLTYKVGDKIQIKEDAFSISQHHLLELIPINGKIVEIKDICYNGCLIDEFGGGVILWKYFDIIYNKCE